MKKIISNKELRERMKDAINILCDTVKTTLGPKGSNIIIDHSTFSPFITNDGVTIAKNIESEDEIINTILEIAKESTINTNEKVGDGTTTTLVLLQSIFNNGLKLIEQGKNPIILKKEIDEHIPFIINEINNHNRRINRNELLNIAKTSSNSEELGKLITEGYLKVKNVNAITVKENIDIKNKIILKKGYIIETLIPSINFFEDKNKINLNNTYILIVDSYLNDIEEISNILNFIIKNNYELLIICEEYSQIFINQILSLLLNEKIKIYLLKTPEYGKNKIDTLNDISLISGAKINENIDYLNETVLGNISKITITKEETTFQILENQKIKNKIKELKKIKKTNDIDINFLNKRISMFKNGLIEILIGGATETERREKIMRCEDAINAISSSMNGIVPGSGIVLYEISESIPVINESTEILKKSLKEPFNQIMDNAGINSDEIISKIKEKNYQVIYNVNKNDYESKTITEIIDPTNVVINSIINAISTSAMLLTTTSLIVNEHINNTNKIESYNEL